MNRKEIAMRLETLGQYLCDAAGAKANPTGTLLLRAAHALLELSWEAAKYEVTEIEDLPKADKALADVDRLNRESSRRFADETVPERVAKAISDRQTYTYIHVHSGVRNEDLARAIENLRGLGYTVAYSWCNSQIYVQWGNNE